MKIWRLGCGGRRGEEGSGRMTERKREWGLWDGGVVCVCRRIIKHRFRTMMKTATRCQTRGLWVVQPAAFCWAPQISKEGEEKGGGARRRSRKKEKGRLKVQTGRRKESEIRDLDGNGGSWTKQRKTGIEQSEGEIWCIKKSEGKKTF